MNQKEILKQLKKQKFKVNKPFKGCTEAELKSLEDELGHRLPDTYREYLLAAGYEAGRLFQGTDVSFANLRENQTYARELLTKNHNPFQLPESAIIFSVHQGYEIRYFVLNEGENPPIYEWYEGCDGPAKISDSFEEFLIEQMGLHAKVNWNQIYQDKKKGFIKRILGK